MKLNQLIAVLIILSLTFVMAADFTPQGPINLRGIYNISNAVNISAQQFCNATDCFTITQLTSSAEGDITSVQGDNIYVYNGSSLGDVHLAFNETKLNQSIELLDTDTTYTAGSNLSLSGTVFSANMTSILAYIQSVISLIYVPYTGATSNVNLATYNITNASSLTLTGGQPIDWAPDQYTYQFPSGLGNMYQLGQELTLIRKNNAGQTIYEGQVVYIEGSQGSEVLVNLADASNGDKILGLGMVTVPSCNANAACPITYFGDVNELDTSGYAEGTRLYLSADGSGNVTDTAPGGDNYNIVIGTVARNHSTQGIIDVSHIGYINFADDPRVNNLTVFDTLNVSNTIYENGSSLSDKYVAVVGDIMTGNLTVPGLVVTENINLSSYGYVYLGPNGVDSPFIRGNGFHGYGDVNTSGVVIVEGSKNNPSQANFMVYGENPSGFNVPRLIIQDGGVGRASMLVRSLCVINDDASWLNGSVNSDDLTNCTAYLNHVGEVPQIDFNTATTGADLYVGDDMQVSGDVYIKDSDGEYHFLTRTLSLLDENQDYTVLSQLNITLSNNNLTIIDKDEDPINVVIDENYTILDSASDSIIVSAGTNTTPNNVYVYYSGFPPVLTTSTTNPGTVADVARVKLGANYSYGSVSGSAHQSMLTRNLYFRAFDSGAIYVSGYIPNVTTSQINISTGTMNAVLERKTSTNNLAMEDAYTILANGSFMQLNNLQSITQYADTGTAIGNNKLFNVVCGVVSDEVIGDGGRNAEMWCGAQNEPTLEYITVVGAEVDEYNTVVLSPDDELLSKIYVPVVRVVVRRSGGVNTIQNLSNGDLFFDLRGQTIASGSSPSTPNIYTAGSNLTLTDNVFSLDTSAVLTWLNAVFEPISSHFDASTTVNITCLDSPSCNWYMNATDSCMYWPSGGKDCGAA